MVEAGRPSGDEQDYLHAEDSMRYSKYAQVMVSFAIFAALPVWSDFVVAQETVGRRDSSAWRRDSSAGTPFARRLEALAPDLVKSADIKPGQVVTIHGGPPMVHAMEAFAIEVQKGGATPLMILESPKVVHSYFKDVPDKYLGRIPQSWQDFQAGGVDVEFNLPVFENFQAALADVPVDRQGKVIAAFTSGQAKLTERQNRNLLRRLNINAPPTPVDAEQARLDSATYARMYEGGLRSDYSRIAERGRRVQQALQGARRVRITTPEGTDLTFSVGSRPVILDAGIASTETRGLLAARTAQLPGGALRLAPVETSVAGKIRAPSDQCDKPVKDEAIDVRGGMPENVRAASDEECVKEAVQRAGRFGWVEIGLNPALRVSDPKVNLTSSLLDLGAGTVTVNFGTNQELGGENKTASGGWLIALPRANVEADGKIVVRNGELAM
jgi:leucyl aminopeptidase (aminopeptidase T)